MRNKFPELYKHLWPYQRVGVRRLIAMDGRAMLADQPGLGKTIQVIAYLAMNPTIRPAIIICPAIAKHHWKRTADKWLPNDTNVVLSGRTSYDLTNGTIFIINYDILANKEIDYHGTFCFARYPDIEPIKSPKHGINSIEIPYSGWIDYLCDLNAPFLAIDEFQKVSNRKSQRTNAIIRLAKKPKYLIEISGTPSENRPSELYHPVSWLAPHLFPNKRTYQIRYCGPKNTGFGTSFTGASNIAELHKILVDNIMIRRTKKEIMEDLPSKIRSIVPLDIINREEYDTADYAFGEWIKKTKGDNTKYIHHFAKLEALKQLAIKGKIKQVLDWVSDYLEGGEKLVVFAQHKNTVNVLMRKFGQIAVKVDGSVLAKQRSIAEEQFQTNKKIRLFIGNIEAAGVSLTLTAANAVAMIEMPNTPAKLEQCEDRVYGRINDCHGATIYFLVAVNTIEEDLAELLDKKSKVLTRMFDGKNITEEKLLTELIKKRYSN